MIYLLSRLDRDPQADIPLVMSGISQTSKGIQLPGKPNYGILTLRVQSSSIVPLHVDSLHARLIVSPIASVFMMYTND